MRLITPRSNQRGRARRRCCVVVLDRLVRRALHRALADLVADEEVLALLLEALIERNRAEGRELGVDGTPRIFVNGRPFTEPVEALDTYVREELARIDARR